MKACSSQGVTGKDKRADCLLNDMANGRLKKRQATSPLLDTQSQTSGINRNLVSVNPVTSRECVKPIQMFALPKKSSTVAALLNGIGFRSIQAAVEAAEDGDRVAIPPGTYILPHGLTIRKSISIVGTSASNVDLQTGNGTALDCLDGVTVIWTGEGAKGKMTGLDICNNSVDKSAQYPGNSASGAGILVTNGADPTLSNCRVFNCKGVGVRICQRGKGQLVGCDIFGNTEHGVVVEGEGTDPVIRANTIHDGNSSGVVVRSQAAGLLEDNNIYGHVLDGVKVKGKGTCPIVRGNQIHHGKDTGVYILGQAQCSITDNNIHTNAQAGVLITGAGTHPTVAGNKIHSGCSAGVCVDDGAAGLFKGNDIYGNKQSGVQIMGKRTNPVLEVVALVVVYKTPIPAL